MATRNFDMDSDESFHSESEFYYPNEVENHNDKKNTGLLREENPQSTQFTMASVQKYILSQRTENTVKKTEYDLNVWKRFLEIGEERNIEDIPAAELNILICRFMMDMKKKDGGEYVPATLFREYFPSDDLIVFEEKIVIVIELSEFACHADDLNCSFKSVHAFFSLIRADFQLTGVRCDRHLLKNVSSF